MVQYSDIIVYTTSREPQKCENLLGVLLQTNKLNLHKRYLD